MLRREFVALAFAAAAPRFVRLQVRPQTAGDVLDPRAIEVQIGRTPARIQRVWTPADPQMILLVVDLVGDLGAVEPAKEALATAISGLPAQTTVAVLRAQDGLSVVADPANDNTAAIDAVRQMPVSGRPGLLETLDGALRLADSIAAKSPVRIAVFYVSDSNAAEYREDFANPVINSSDPHDLSRRFPETLIQEKLSKMAHTLAGRQTAPYLSHIVYRGDRLNEAYLSGLDQLFTRLGGAAAICRTRGDIPASIAQTIAALRSEYTLLVALPERTGASAQIQVTAGSTPVIYRTHFTPKEK